jgi:hypothetical protein
MLRARVMLLAMLVATSEALRPCVAPFQPLAAARPGRVAMVAPELSAKLAPGRPSPKDDSEFLNDPRQYCADAVRQYGPIFSSGVFDGVTVVGDSDALRAIASSGSASEQKARPPLAPPFALAASDGSDPFEEYAEAFSDACYRIIFEWIPKYKEAGFSTFRFEDFFDDRIRKLRPSLRTLVLRSAAPALFGMAFDEVPAALGFENAADVEKAYAAYAATFAAPSGGALPFGLQLPSLAGGGGGDAGALEAALERLSTRDGGGRTLWHVASSVEQTVALLCNLIAASEAHPALAKELAAEQAAALKGAQPNAPITPELLGALPALDAFVRETLRTAPPARPHRLVLSAPLDVPSSKGPVGLAAGTVVAPEPFAVAASDFADPATFDPSRFGAAEGAAPLLIPFARAPSALEGGEGGAWPAGESLAISMAKATYVQLRRMFDDVKISASPPATPSGVPLYTLNDKVEVLFNPRMYYSLQRGVKKLRF